MPLIIQSNYKLLLIGIRRDFCFDILVIPHHILQYQFINKHIFRTAFNSHSPNSTCIINKGNPAKSPDQTLENRAIQCLEDSLNRFAVLKLGKIYSLIDHEIFNDLVADEFRLFGKIIKLRWASNPFNFKFELENKKCISQGNLIEELKAYGNFLQGHEDAIRTAIDNLVRQINGTIEELIVRLTQEKNTICPNLRYYNDLLGLANIENNQLVIDEANLELLRLNNRQDIREINEHIEQLRNENKQILAKSRFFICTHLIPKRE